MAINDAVKVAKLKRFNARIPATLDREDAAIAKLTRKPRIKPVEGLRILYSLLDKYARYAQGLVACKAGCAYCCHSEIAVSELEADLIAAEYRITKGTPLAVQPGKSERYCDKTRPCPFLTRDQQCAIYHHRPLLCRTHFSFELSGAPCSFDADPDGEIALLDREKSWPGTMRAYGELAHRHGGRWADIRQWFAPFGNTDASGPGFGPRCPVSRASDERHYR